MIRVLQIKLANFRSFSKPSAVTTIDLRGLRGLVHLSGDNGAGKSSIMDAVHWCLYGRTSRGVRAGNVRSWRGKGPAYVGIRLERDSCPYDVERRWGPNSLTINGEPVEQARVEELVGLREDEFLHSVYRAQFAPSFLDLAPGAQLALYSQVMQLERWERASERAGKAASALDAEVSDLEREVARALGRLEELRERQIPALRSDKAEWDRSQRELIKQKEAELRRLR